MSRLDRDREIETEEFKEYDARYIPVPMLSSFTAINRQPTQLLTPESSASPIQQNQARRRAACVRRRHNPTVAKYLGIGSKNDPPRLEKYGLPSPVPESSDLRPTPTRKRQRLVIDEIKPDHIKTDEAIKSMPDQRQLTESFHVSQIACRPAAVNPSASNSTTFLPGSSPLGTVLQSQLFDYHIFANLPQDQPPHVAHKMTMKKESLRAELYGAKQKRVPGLIQPPQDSALLTDIDNIDGPPNCISDSLKHNFTSPAFYGDDFSDDLSDNDLLMLMSNMDNAFLNNTGKAPKPLLSSDTLANLQEIDHDHGPNSFAMIPNNSKQNSTIHSSGGLSKGFTSPVTAITRLLAADSDMNAENPRKPIVRPSFPAPVRDHSPIVGLSSNTLLRTCFRIGEAINQSYQASKSDKHIIIELYARVLNSERTEKNQVFTFCDLFHAKPPYIKAVYDATIWKSVQLFEYDSRRLLQEGRVCRCIGTMKRNEKEWTMTVLNIWEAAWDDIRWVEGIVSS